MISTAVFIVILIGIFTYYIINSRKNNTLPGPKGIPFLGNLFQLGKYPADKFIQWAIEFGPIYQIKFGRQRLIVLNDPKLVKEMFSQVEFTGRQEEHAIVADMYDGTINHGVVMTEGGHWEQLRRFSLRQLRDFGLGKSSFESCIMDDVNETLKWMKLHEGEHITNIKEKFSLAVVSSLWGIIGGQRCSHDDPVLLNLANGMTKALEVISEGGSYIFFAPWLRYIIPEYSGYNGIRRARADLRKFFDNAVLEHKKSMSQDFSRDLIDSFIKEIEKTTDPKSAFYKDLGERHFIATIADLFFAGSDTTSTTLSWAMLYLTKFPKTQEKLQKEIENVTGNSRYCCLADRHNIPFAEALISEILRFSSITPVGLPHRAIVRKEVCGITVEKDDIMMANFGFIHKNPEIWGDPENFRVERFLSEDGKTFKKNDALLTFSAGKRQCLGENLARDVLFLFITNIFQKFSATNVNSTSNPELIDLEPIAGFNVLPKPYTLILTDRLI